MFFYTNLLSYSSYINTRRHIFFTNMIDLVALRKYNWFCDQKTFPSYACLLQENDDWITARNYKYLVLYMLESRVRTISERSYILSLFGTTPTRGYHTRGALWEVGSPSAKLTQRAFWWKRIYAICSTAFSVKIKRY